jgi:hypothetical protein
MSIKDFIFGTSGDAYSDAVSRQTGTNQNFRGDVGQALQPWEALAGSVDSPAIFQEYIRQLQAQDPSQFGVSYDPVAYQDPLSRVNEFLDPSIQFQTDQARRGVEASAAGRGGLFSGATGRDISEATRQVAETGWGRAFDRAQAEDEARRNASLQNLSGGINAGTFNLGLQNTSLDRLGRATETALTPQSMATQGRLDLASQLFGTSSGLNQQGMAIQGQDKGIFGDLVRGGAQVLGSILGGM